ncbi:MAG: carboxynorspermidine decarboxylase [bacterium]|nr:carboxynorspermidine decarboxylase [bacterium]MDO5463200.1 carboxynorspermidine decarboxylase [bacterium]
MTSPEPFATPAFVIDTLALQRNAMILTEVAQRSGAHMLLALKAFSTTAAFPYMKAEGTCASSVHEARLGMECFGGEQHAFAAAFSIADMNALLDLGIHHITLNSFAQLRQWQKLAANHPNGAKVQVGLRINPEHSEGQVPIYDPCAPHSRLGIKRDAFDGEDLTGVTGLHCHNLCEQNSDCFARTLVAIEEKFGDLLPQIQWFNFGGGHHITREDYDRTLLIQTLQAFHQRYPHIKMYLEPGEAHVLNAGTFVATVLDIVDNAGPIAILDASAACHTPDVIEMPYRPRAFIDHHWSGEATPTTSALCAGEANQKSYTVRLTGPSCLAGDIFGDYSFDRPLHVGDRIIFEDMALYTMVKTNTFNGIALPDILLRTNPNVYTRVKHFGYEDFRSRL